jgi:hypothetical protein
VPRISTLITLSPSLEAVAAWELSCRQIDLRSGSTVTRPIVDVMNVGVAGFDFAELVDANASKHAISKP